VKNTFLTVIEHPDPQRLSRSHSDSEVDGSSSSTYGRATDNGQEFGNEVAERSETDDSTLDSVGPRAAWSKGSALHESGQCKPCLYVGTKSGCINGAECGFCHAGHRRSRPRPSKSTRTKCKQIVAQMGTQEGTEESEALAEYSPYIRSLLRGKLQDAGAAGSSAGGSGQTSPTAASVAVSASSSSQQPQASGQVPSKGQPTKPRQLKVSL